MLSHYLYRSMTSISTGHPDLKRIYALSNSRNQLYSITGCLLLEDGIFYQWLEGPSVEVEMIMSLIRKDQKHHDIKILSSGLSDTRYFEDWAMAAPATHRESLFDYLSSYKISKHRRNAFSQGIRNYMKKHATMPKME